MSESKNWKADAIPSLDGRKTELHVSGEVKSGINPPRLKKSEAKEKRPPNVVALDILNIAGGPFAPVKYTEDITGKDDYNIVLVYTEKSEIEAAIPINRNIQSLK